jgi:hypothetical protein
MGMYGTLCRISERQLARITAAPERAASLLSRDGPVRSKPWRILRLDKAWDVLDKGLNLGSKEGPLADAIHGVHGAKIGPSLSYGRARHLTPAQVRATAIALRAFPESTFRQRWRSGALRDAYVFGALSGPEPAAASATPYDDLLADLAIPGEEGDPLEEILEQLRALVRFYGRAEKRGDGMIMAVT